MTTDDVLTWICQYCGEENEVWVDLTIEDKQDLIEDCYRGLDRTELLS